MNRIFKVIWSKAKNCYVVASELAKSHTKSPKSWVISRSVVAGVLACVLSCGVVMPSAFADRVIDNYSGTISGDLSTINYSVPASDLTTHRISIINDAFTGGGIMSPLIFDDSHVGSFSSGVKNAISSILGVPIDSLTFQGNKVYGDVSAIHDPVTGQEVVLEYLYEPTSWFEFTSDGDYFYLSNTDFNYSGYDITLINIMSHFGDISVLNNPGGSLAINNSNFSVTGNVPADSITSTNSTFSANSIKTTSGDIAASSSNLTATNTIESAGAINATSNSTVSSGSTMTTSVLTASDSTVSSSDSINVTGGVADGGDTVGVSLSNGSTLTSTNDTTVTNTLKLAGASTVDTGGTLSAKSIKGTGENTITADKVVTTNGDIDASDSSVTATDSVETTGVVKLKSLNAPRLLGAGSGMSTLGGGLTVAGQIKGVTAGTADTDAVNVAQLNSAIAGASTPYIGINSASGGGNEDGSGAYGTDSIAIGKDVYSLGNNSVVLGNNSLADINVNNVFVLGNNVTVNNGEIPSNWEDLTDELKSSVTGDGVVALGNDVSVSLDNKYVTSSTTPEDLARAKIQHVVAIGDGAIIGEENAIAVGFASSSKGLNATAVGSGAGAWGEGTTAIGSNAIAIPPSYDVEKDVSFATAIGYQAQATAKDAVALGSNSVANDDNTVSVGSSSLKRKIVNVADGVASNDVATVGQLNSLKSNSIIRIETIADSDTITFYDGAGNRTVFRAVDTNTTYDNMSASELTTGTATTARSISAKTIADYVTDKISDESTARGTAISSEAIARADADTALGTRIDDEVAARQAAVTTLQGALSSLSGNAVQYDGEDKSAITLGGTEGTTLSNVKAGTLSATSTEAVNGSQLYSTNEAIAREATARQDADTALSNRIGTLSADGTYILKDNSVSVNLSALDTGLKAEKDAREAAVSAINAGITSLSGNAVQYTDDTKAIVALGGTDGTTISNVKAGTLSATSTEAVTGSQLFTTNTNLANETTARETADTALGGRIDTEITDRTNADTVLDNKIAAETTARENAISQLTQSISDLGGNAVQYDSTDKSAITLGGGESGTVIANVKAGTLSADSTEAVNGSQLYSTNQALAQEVTDRTTAVSNEAAERESADTALDGRIGVIAEDGEYIKKSSTNSIAANLSILDLRMKANADDISGLKDLSNITGSGETVIRNLAKGSVKVASGNYTNIVKGTDGNADSYTVNVIANGEAAEGNTGLMTGGAVYTAVKGAVDAFSPANISDAAAAQWAERLGTGVVAQDSSGLISGKTLYNEVHVADGNVIRATNTVGQNLSALDAGLKTVGTDVAGIKANAIQYDDASKTAITLGNGTNVTTIRNVAAGELSSASKDAVNGGQLYSVRDKLQKADGIDKGKWQEVLGDGQVELDNTGLVTGDTVYKAIKATAATASVRMIGINSNDKNDVNYSGGGAVGKDAVAVGSGVEAKGDNAVAMGKDSKAEGVQSVAIGHGSQALGLQSVVIGTSNKVTGNHSGAFGDPNYVTGDNSYAFGNNNSVSGSNTFVLGNNVKASGKNSVVLGAGSDGSEDNVVSVGAKGNERRITHVADGQTMTDAATVGQLSRLAQVADDGLRYLDRRVNKAGAGAAALAALHPLDMDGKFGMAAGYGNYHSTHAMALGLFYQPKDNVMFSIGGTIGNGDNMINAGVSIALDKGFTNSKAAMARNIRNLTAENAAMKEKLEAQGNEIKELKEMLMQLKSQMQKQ